MAGMSMGLKHVSRIRTNGIGMDTIRASNSVYSYQLQQFVWDDLSLNCLRRVEDDKRQELHEVRYKRVCSFSPEECLNRKPVHVYIIICSSFH